MVEASLSAASVAEANFFFFSSAHNQLGYRMVTLPYVGITVRLICSCAVSDWGQALYILCAVCSFPVGRDEKLGAGLEMEIGTLKAGSEVGLA